MIASISSGRTSMLTSDSAVTPPKRSVMPSARRTGAALAALLVVDVAMVGVKVMKRR
jgi:hypothetical protein